MNLRVIVLDNRRVNRSEVLGLPLVNVRLTRSPHAQSTGQSIACVSGVIGDPLGQRPIIEVGTDEPATGRPQVRAAADLTFPTTELLSGRESPASAQEAPALFGHITSWT